MHSSVLRFGYQTLLPHTIRGKNFLEVGSLNVNGSLRDHVMAYDPLGYIGTDMVPGVGVDLVVSAEDLPGVFLPATFDVIICTEMLEHAENWWTCLYRMTPLLHIGGHLLLTTRSPGFPRHNHPEDFWRFTLENLGAELRRIGYQILEPSGKDTDPASPGVFFWCKLVRFMPGLFEPLTTPEPAPMR